MEEMNKPLVSIVVITYRSESYILETLESIYAQTWNAIELIVSDDGSPDNTIKLCEDWLKQHKDRFFKTKLITVSQNTGITANFKRGINSVSGTWIKTLGGDDLLMPTCIADNMNYAQTHPEVSIITSNLQEIDANSAIIRETVSNEGLKYFLSTQNKIGPQKAYSRWPAFLNTPTFFCKKELFPIILQCDDDFKIYEDMSAVFRIIEHDIAIHYMDKTTIKYRIHPNAISRNPLAEARREQEAYIIFNKFRKKNLSIFNPIDLSIYYETWLRFKYKGLFGYKGINILRKFSLFYWQLRLNGYKEFWV